MRKKAVICIMIAAFITMSACRSEPEEETVKINSIRFNKDGVTLKIGEETTVRVTVGPNEAKRNERVRYSSTNEGIIELLEETNDGFIIKGIKGGSTVIKAESANVTSYLEVSVENDLIITTYINVANPVIEILEGERRSTQVSLYGGSVLDNNEFIWGLEPGKDILSIDVTANIAVITGLKGGYQKIIVSHPKADYESEILVFVKGADEEEIKYISSMSNVVLVPNDGQYHDFSVVLINGQPEDVINFEYTVIEGEETIEIVPNGNVCNVKGIVDGSSVIRVTHPLAVVEFDMRIITYDVDFPFIILGKTFLLMNIGESDNIEATVENARNGIVSNDEFTYTIMENDIVVESENSPVEVVQSNNYFFIRGRRGGTARIVISNEQAQMSREILVVVREEIVYRDDYYITTSQNVIMTQVGADAVQLNMQLINGNNADANSFEWEVDDGTLITVESAHGIVRSNRAAIKSVFNAIALITPKSAGTAKITVSHPKSEVTASVMVKVYPKGTFVEPPILVGYEGLIKVISGTPKTVQLNMVSGDILDVGTLDWTVTDTNIATVNASAHGMVNVLNALDNGMTKMVVDGAKLEYPHESLILAGTPEFVDMASVIYVDSVYQKMVTEQTVRIEVKDSQNIYRNSNDYKAVVEDGSLLYAVMIKNQLVMQGKDVGETKVRITNDYAINEILLNVRIDPAYIHIDKPYYISGPDIVGVVRGIGKDINVSLAGANESETGKLVWSVDDTSVANVIASGSNGIITGRVSNKQTKIRVRHQKAEEEKVLLVYVVENEADLYNKVALGLKSENYILVTGNEQLITLITNANETQKLGLRWKIRDEADGVLSNSVISVDPHYDSAMIRAIGEGHAEIVVTHNDNILPLSIYISVVDALSAEKVIRGPAVIELIREQSKIVSVSHVNLSPEEVRNIHWEIETPNSEIANLQENGDSAYLLGKNKGIDYVNIRQDSIGYQHRATLVCANTAKELETLYVMGVESSYHTMMIGEEKRIRLSFGSAGFPETARKNLVWTADDSRKVKVVGSGDSVTIVAEEEGEATITVRDTNDPLVSFNETLELKVLVHKKGAILNLYEFRGHEKIKGIVNGNTARITMRLYQGNNEITTGYSLLEHENSDDHIITVDRADNILNITAKNTGQSYITVKHEQAVENAKILIYTAATEAELDLYYPILVEKTNYLLQVGEQATLKIETLGGDKDVQNFKNVSWGIENANVLENVDFNGKKEVVIKARAEGQCIVSVSYQGKVVERIFITVVGNDTVDMTKYITTASIIGLVKGESYNTKIVSNLGASEIASILWESTNTGVVTVTGSGDSGTLTGIVKGEAYVTVSYGSWLKRHILVYVCDTKAQVDAYKAMNMESQYHRVGLNENLILAMHYAPNKTTASTLWIDKYDNKVVRFTSLENGGKLDITTLNEGVAVLEATNTGLSTPTGVLRIYIEVSKRYNNAPKPPDPPKYGRYLTISKTVYWMNSKEPTIPLYLSVSGVGMTVDELMKVKWTIETGSQYVELINSIGKDCTVRNKGIDGEATLVISGADNLVRVTIIINSTGLVGYPYIVGDDVIRVAVGQEVFVEYDVAEIQSYDTSRFGLTVPQGGANVEANFLGAQLRVKGLKTGSSLLRINHPECKDYKDVLIIITQVMIGSTPSGLVYLTTRDNFTIVNTEEYKTLTVNMVGFENPPIGGWTWKADNDAYISISPSGNQAQVKGKPAGKGQTVMITVSYSNSNSQPPVVNPIYNLKLYVRIANEASTVKYISVQQTVVSVANGSSIYLTANVVNGSPEDNNKFTFTAFNDTTTPNSTSNITVASAGNMAVIKGKVADSMAKVNIANSTTGIANNNVKVLVVVEPETAASGLYFTMDSTLIEMKPNENRQIRVNLVGGEAQQIFGFVWPTQESHITHNSFEKGAGNTNLNVITLAGNADSAIITAIREGDATFKIQHTDIPNYQLNVTVSVRIYSAISFKQKRVEVTVGGITYVEVERPTGVTVIYAATKNSSNQVVVDVSNSTSTMCVIKGVMVGISVVKANNATGSLYDELVVEVKAAPVITSGYIVTPATVYNMNNWRSSANRKVITGNTTGNKDNGLAFNSNDDNDIWWEIPEDSQKYIKFYDPSSGSSYKIKDKMVSVYSLGEVGIAEIEASHDSLPIDYKKKIFINIMEYDANFTINPNVAQMSINGTPQKFTVNINNTLEPDYRDVIWRERELEQGTSFPDLGITGEIVGQGDGPGGKDDPNKNWKKVYEITAHNDGLYEVEAEYKGALTSATIFVEKLRVFEVMDDGFITILPNETHFIGLKVLPENSEVTIHTDYNDYLWFDNCNTAGIITGTGFPTYPTIIDTHKDRNNKDIEPFDLHARYELRKHLMRYEVEVDANGNKILDATGKEIPIYNKPLFNTILAITGKEREGYTKITMTSNNIERVVTVYTDLNHTFRMKGIIEKDAQGNETMIETTVIRGKPGDEFTIEYEIFPEKDPVNLVKDSEYMKNGNLIMKDYPLIYTDLNNNLSIDNDKQRIQIKLDKCGYGKVEFESNYNKEVGVNMEIEVYVYYDNVDVTWSKGNNPTYSWFDNAQNAIYVAKGETIQIDCIVDEGIYPGNMVEIRIKGNISDSVINIYLIGQNPKKSFTVTYSGTAPTSSSIFEKVTYKDLCEIEYDFFTGGKEVTHFTKRFMVYTLDYK